MHSAIEEKIKIRVEALPEGLRQHTYRVEQLALELARRHELDWEKVRLGALAHDIARAMKGDQLIHAAKEMGIAVHPVETRLPVLLHGPVGAELMRRMDRLDDQDVYEAVYWHSTSHECLGPTAMVVFLADKLDPQKADRYPFIPEVRELAVESLDRAVLEFLNREILSLLERGNLVHPASLEARNQRLMKTP